MSYSAWIIPVTTNEYDITRRTTFWKIPQNNSDWCLKVKEKFCDKTSVSRVPLILLRNVLDSVTRETVRPIYLFKYLCNIVSYRLSYLRRLNFLAYLTIKKKTRPFFFFFFFYKIKRLTENRLYRISLRSIDRRLVLRGHRLYDRTSLKTSEPHFCRVSDKIRPKSWPTLRSLLSHFQIFTFTVVSPLFPSSRQNHCKETRHR